MNCHLSRLLLAFRPNELAADDRVALDAHLATCPICAAASSADGAVDAAIRRAMVAIPVPSGLRAKIHAGVTARQSATWRRKVGWASGLLAASVAIALAVPLAVYFTRPVLTTERVGWYLESEQLTPEQSVRDWLKSEGLPTELPETLPFEFRYHAAHGSGPLGPHKVPFVLFQNEHGQCRVYVLRANSVHTPVNGWAPVFGSEFNIQAIERGEYVYLIAVSSGTTLDTFLKVPPPVA